MFRTLYKTNKFFFHKLLIISPLTICIHFLFLILFSPKIRLHAFPKDKIRQNQGLVLPFRIDGNKKSVQNFLSSKYPAIDLQIASLFLLKNHYTYPFFSFSKTRDFINALQVKHNFLLQTKEAEILCNSSEASHLIETSVHLANQKRLVITLSLFSCLTNQFIKRQSRAVNSRVQIQEAMKQLFQASIGFAKPRIKYNTSQQSSSFASNSDIALLLDFSGSMNGEIPEILHHLTFLQENLSSSLSIGKNSIGKNLIEKNRLGVIAIEDKDQVSTIPMNTNWRRTIQLLNRKAIRGEVSKKGFEKALTIIERYETWQKPAFLLFFTDIPLKKRDQYRYIPRLNALKKSGLNLCFFPLSRQTRNTKRIWNKIANRLDIKTDSSNEIIYARRVFLAGKGRLFFLQKGIQFFLTKKDISSQVKHNRLDTKMLIPIETNQYNEGELTLERLPYAYARKRNDKILRLGTYFSNIGKGIANCLSPQLYKNQQIKGKALVRNGKRAFWINVNETTLLKLEKQIGQKIFMGLHWEKRQEKLFNLASPIYVQKNRKKVPDLFLWEETKLSSFPKEDIQKEDIWFMELEILKVKM